MLRTHQFTRVSSDFLKLIHGSIYGQNRINHSTCTFLFIDYTFMQTIFSYQILVLCVEKVSKVRKTGVKKYILYMAI